MKGIILLNGEPFEGEIAWSEEDIVLSADGALAWAKDKINIDITAGDFDSLGYVPKNSVVYPSEKDYTDGEIALDILIGKGCREIEIYGGGGKREDHFFGNLQLLYAAFSRGVKCVMKSRYCDVFCASGRVELFGMKGKTVSLAPVGLSAHIMESEGLKYPLQDLTLTAGSCRGISNVAESDRAWVFSDKGTLFVFLVHCKE